MPDLSNETMLHLKNDSIEYLQFRKLLEYSDKVVHCYTLKGDSNNDYESIKDDNYKLLYNAINLDYSGFTKIEHQAHSDIVEKVDNINKDKKYTDIDGLITNNKGISLSLRFADCTPILFYDPIKNAIGNIHSGWRGTVQKIGQKGALKMIRTYNCDAKDLLCFIGPAIAKCHFEVEEDVKEQFKNTFSYLLKKEEFIEKGQIKEGKQKYFIDTNIINRKLLEEIGIPSENIIESNICTVCNSNYMHSYRKDKEKAGRNTMIIGLK